MLTHIHPKLPMRDKAATRQFYVGQLGFTDLGKTDYPDYLIVGKNNIEIHFFNHPSLNPLENDGQVYIRTSSIHDLYLDLEKRGIRAAAPEMKHWGQIEFSILDPDHNLLTFGQAL